MPNYLMRGTPRDPARIDRVLELLREYWLANPDLRLGQILGNFRGKATSYGVEDDVIEARLKEALGRDR